MPTQRSVSSRSHRRWAPQVRFALVLGLLAVAGGATAAGVPGGALAATSGTAAVDTGGDVGKYAAIAIGVDGLPVISYFDDTNDDLKVAHCNDPACSGGDETLSRVDGLSVIVGQYTDIAIGTDGFPVISYYDIGSRDLKVAHCSDLACTGEDETITRLDSTGIVGQYTSIAVGADGLPVVSYFDDTNDDLKAAHCNDPACAGSDETVTVLDSTGEVGKHTSIAIGRDGRPVISYFDDTNNDLKVAHCANALCTTATTTTVDGTGSVGEYSSIAVGADGLPVISYLDSSNHDLKVAHCNDRACSGGDETLTAAVTSGDVGDHASIAIGIGGWPVLSFYNNGTDDLTISVCHDLICTSPGSTPYDSAGDVGQYTSIARGSDGRPVIAYYDVTNADLKVAYCSQSFCAGAMALTLDRYTVDSGGGRGAGGGLALHATVGQPDAAVARSSQAILHGGFWFGGNGAQRGDCNADGAVDAADVTGMVLELFDGDGADPANVPGSTYPGNSVGCNANADLTEDAGDISCVVLIIFHGLAACN